MTSSPCVPGDELTGPDGVWTDDPVPGGTSAPVGLMSESPSHNATTRTAAARPPRITIARMISNGRRRRRRLVGSRGQQSLEQHLECPNGLAAVGNIRTKQHKPPLARWHGERCSLVDQMFSSHCPTADQGVAIAVAGDYLNPVSIHFKDRRAAEHRRLVPAHPGSQRMRGVYIQSDQGTRDVELFTPGCPAAILSF